MANCCMYDMVAVAPKKETLERLIKIMNYKDEEYFIYRCRSVSEDEITFDENSNLYYVGIQGEVAWGCDKWFDTIENKEDLIHLGYENNDYSKPILGTAHYITLDLLCSKLDFGIEVFGEESGCCFQQYFACNHKGEHHHDSAHWVEHWCDDDGNELDEPYEEGGLDYYGDFNDFEEIYG